MGNKGSILVGIGVVLVGVHIFGKREVVEASTVTAVGQMTGTFFGSGRQGLKMDSVCNKAANSAANRGRVNLVVNG